MRQTGKITLGWGEMNGFIAMDTVPREKLGVRCLFKGTSAMTQRGRGKCCSPELPTYISEYKLVILRIYFRIYTL